MKAISPFLVLVAFVMLCTNASAQLTVNDQATANDLTNTISGNGVQISNVTMNCSNGAYGTFNSNGSNVGLNDGIVLTTGLLQTPTGCAYTLELTDANMNGWPCGSMTVTINGTVVGTYSEASTMGFTSIPILVNPGDNLQIDYATTGGGGCNEGQNGFTLYDEDFAVLATGTGPLGGGNKYTGVVGPCTAGMTAGYGVVGPNDANLAGFANGNNFSDPDVVAMEPQATFDVCAMEFDIVPICNLLEITYVFASEEYPDFVCSNYNDAFGFFISGPGIAGPYQNGAENIAIVPGTNDFVAINTINNGAVGTSGAAGGCGGAGDPGLGNTAYFVNGGNGMNCPGPGFCNNPNRIRYNGLTTPLTATSPVVPCETYHMKIIIADAGDGSYDSGVFLNYEGLQCPGKDIDLVGVATAMVEGCVDGQFTINRTGDLTQPVTITFIFNGTATNGVDYSIPATVNMAANQTTATVDVNAILDATLEGTETVEIVAQWDICGQQQYDTLQMTIVDGLSIQASTTQHESCSGMCDGAVNTTVTGGTGTLTYSWNNGAGNVTSQTNVCAGTYTVSVADANACPATATTVVNPGPLLTAAFVNTTNGNQCETGNSYSFDASTSTIDIGTITGYAWDFGDGSTGTGVTTTHSYATDGSYTVGLTITDGTCTSTTSLVVNVMDQPTVTLVSPNPNCASTSGEMTATGAAGTPAYTYTWSNSLATGSGASQTHNTLADGTYTVTITDANTCTNTASVNIIQPPAMTLTQICNDATTMGGTEGSSNATVTGGATPYTYSWNPAAGNVSNLTNLGAGTYDLTVTDNNGCVITSSCVVNEPSCPGTPTITVTETSCAGGNDGTATYSVVGSLGTSFTYLWTNGDNAITATGLGAGPHSVTVTDNNGCVIISNTVITSPTALSITDVLTNLTCFQNNSGNVDITVSGGTPTYSYLWSDGPTTEDRANTTAGTFTVTATDARGCTIVHTAILSEPTALDANTTLTPITCAGAANGTGTVNATGGTTAYSFVWDAGTTAATISNLGAGTTNVTVTDANGCFVVRSVVHTDPAAITVTSTNTTANCGQSDGSVSATVTGGTTPITYAWSSGIGATATINGVPTNTYTVTVTDANGCTGTSSTTVGDLPGATGAIVIDQNVSCFGGCDGQGTVNLTGGTTPFTYTWTVAGNTATASNLCVGPFGVTATDAVGCLTTVTSNIGEPNALSVTMSGNDVTCFSYCDGSATATVAGGITPYAYQWNAGQSTATVNNLCLQTSYVTVTDVMGCTYLDSLKINSPFQITVTTTSVSSNCNQADGALSAAAIGGNGGPFTYAWPPPNNAGATATDLVAAAYQVTVTDNSGCTEVAVGIVSDLGGGAVTIAVDQNASCAGVCDGQATATMTGGTPPYTYAWSNSPTTLTSTGLCAGAVNVTVTDNVGCIAVASENVTEPVVLGATASMTCVSINGATDGTTTVAATGGTTNYGYLWSDLAGSNTITASNLAAGPYAVTVTDNNGCTTIALVTVCEPTPIVTTPIAVAALCFGGNGQVSTTTSGGIPPYTFTWTSGGATVGNTSTVTGLAAGTYVVDIVDANGGTQTGAPVTITEPTQINLSIASQTNVQCFGDCDGNALIDVVGGTSPYSYQWSNGNNAPLASNLCNGNYTATVTDANGCFETIAIVISSPPELVGVMSSNNLSCFGADDGTVNFPVSGGSTAYTYLWSNLSTATSQNGLATGGYCVTVTDGNACTIQSCVTITTPNELVLSGSSTSSTCGNPDGTATVLIGSGDPAFTYQWDAAAANQTTATASNIPAGNYQVTVTDGNQCTEAIVVGVTDIGAPTIAIIGQGDVSCFNLSDGFAQVNVSGGTTPYVYNWDDPAAQSTSSVTGLPAGTWNAVMTDGQGCIASTSVIITQPDVLSAVITNETDVTCFGASDGSANVLVIGGTTPYVYQWNDGDAQVTATATGLAQGGYSVAVTDLNSCNLTITANIGQPAQILATASSVDAFCNTASGSACPTITNGVAPLGYLWSNGQVDSCAANLIPGDYSLVITDVNGCTGQVSVTVGNTPPGTATISDQADASCFNQRDGSATVSIASATAPYTYIWSDTQATAVATGLSAGTYCVTVTDANGCKSPTCVTISQPTQLMNNITATPALCATNNEGLLSASPTGGTSPYAYNWSSTFASTATVSLPAGSYTVTITDINNCTLTDAGTITEPIPMSIDSTVINAICGQANGSASLTVSDGTSPYTYLWNVPAPNDQSTIIGQPAGAYFATVTDNVGCTEIHEVIIGNIDGPTAAITATQNVSCFGGNDGTSTVVMIGGTSTLVSVTWSDGLTTVGTNPTAGNLTAGTFSAEITDADGCKATTLVTVTEPTDLLFSPSSTDPSCFGECDGSTSISLSGGTTPYNVVWSNGQNNNTVDTDEINNLCGGTYSNTVIDGNGCQVTANYTITTPAQLFVSVTETHASCFESTDGTAQAVLTSGGVGTPSFVWNDQSNQTTPIAAGLGAGVYNVTVTDENGCSVIGGTTINQPTAIVAQIDPNSIGNVVCYGDANGYATVQVFGGGVPPFSYFWAGGQTNAQATGLVAGVHTVQVSDANGCTVSLQQVIAQPEILASVISPYTDVTCYGACDGTATVLASGGRTPYFYQWDLAGNGQTSPLAIGLCAADDICVTVTDATGECTSTICVDIDEPQPLIYTVSVTNAHCDQFDGAIAATVEGGSYPYTYSWDPPMVPSGSIFDVHAGAYVLEVLDANGCTYDSTLVVTDIEGPTLTALATPATCAGDSSGTLNFTVMGGTTPYPSPYIWIESSTGDTLHEYAPVIGATGLAQGEYSIQVTDAAGCLGVGVGQVNEPNPLVAFANTTGNAMCFGSNEGIANVVAAGGNTSQPYTYSWNDNNSQTTTTATGLLAGSYSVIVTDNMGCSIVVTTPVTQPDALALSISATDVVCNGDCNGQAVATAGGGVGPYNYTWLPYVGPNPTATNLCPQTLNLTVTDFHGCLITSTDVINEPSVVSADISSDQTTCGNCNATAAVSNEAGGNGAPYTYSWNDGQLTQTASTLCDQSYQVVVSDNRGCSVIKSVTITDLPAPLVDLTFTEPLCYGQPSGSVSANVTLGGNPAITYAWSDNTNSQSAQTAVNITAGVYSVVITDGNGCTATAQTAVGQPDPFDVLLQASNKDLCAGETAQVWGTPVGGTPLSTVPNYDIVWGSTTPGAPGLTPYTVNPSPGTTTFYNITATDANGCVESSTVGITVSPELNLIVPGLLSLCIEQSESICVSATGGQAIDYTFTWSTGEITNVPGTATSCVQVTPTENTTITVVLSDGCSEPQVGEIPIIVNPLPVIAINADNLSACPPFDPGFDISFGSTPTNATVLFDIDYDGVVDYDTLMTNETHVSIPHTYADPGVYSIWAQVISDSGCVQQLTMADYITVHPTPTVAFTADPMEVTQLNPLVFFNGQLSSGVTEDSLWWNFADGQQGTGYFVQNSYQDTGTYWVTLTGVNEYGCIDVDSVPIVVGPDFALYTPNAFTPNGDGLNDYFFPDGIGIDAANFEFNIFDRWGELIFSTTDPNDHWDGTARAKGGSDLIATGVYIWQVKTGNIANSEEASYIGHVTLLK